MIAELSERMAEAAAAGDLEAARVAHEAIARLLGGAPPGNLAEVIDLAARKRRDS